MEESKKNYNEIIVSVIITSKDEAHNIGNCLQSIIRQTYPQEKIEIIVVDNYSTDKTVEIARKYADAVYVIGRNRAAQLNFGAKEAVGKYLLYLDSDMILSDNVIGECVNMCEKDGYIALYIPEKILGKRHFSKVREFERSFYNATCIDAVRFVKKRKFFEINGFDKNLLFGLDDWDFDRRIRTLGRTSIIKTHLYHNETNVTLWKYLKKKAYYVKTFDKYFQKWGRNDSLIKKQFGLFYRYFGVFIEKGKWKKLLRHPLLFIQVFLLKILVGIVFLMSKFKKTQASQRSIMK